MSIFTKIFTAHKRSLREGNVFTFSVCSQRGGVGRGGVPIPQCIAKPSHDVVPYPPRKLVPRPAPPHTPHPVPPCPTLYPPPAPYPAATPKLFFFVQFFLSKFFFFLSKFFFVQFFIFCPNFFSFNFNFFLCVFGHDQVGGVGGTPLAVTQEDCLVYITVNFV